MDRRELKHRWGSKLDEFLLQVQETGGWPEGFTHVSFFHDGPGGDRWCKFTNHHLQTEWFTTVATSDDYYWWKISDARKRDLMRDARKELIGQLK